MVRHNGSDVALLMGMIKVIIDENLQDAGFISSVVKIPKPSGISGALQYRFCGESYGVSCEQVIAAARMLRLAIHLQSSTRGHTEHSHGTDNVMGIADLAM
jgi:formate dehydrogenase major subunit